MSSEVSNVVLYHYPLSRSLRVMWLLNELRVQYEVRRLKLLLGEGYSEEFSQINPNHAVPVVQFVCSGEKHTMFESSALVRFLTALSPKLPKLAGIDVSKCPSPLTLVPQLETGASVREVMEFEQWYAFASNTMDTVLWNFRVINDFRGACPEEKPLLDLFTTKWNDTILPQLEQRFADGRQYCMKSGFTIVDIILGQNLNWAKKYTFLKPMSLKLKEYEKRLKSRPALRESFKDAHLFEKDAEAKL